MIVVRFPITDVDVGVPSGGKLFFLGVKQVSEGVAELIEGVSMSESVNQSNLLSIRFLQAKRSEGYEYAIGSA